MKIKQDLSIGKNLKNLRIHAQLTQESVAQKLQLFGCGTTWAVYAQMEAGKYNIRISELLALKEIFKCEFNDFFADLPSIEKLLETNLNEHE